MTRNDMTNVQDTEEALSTSGKGETFSDIMERSISRRGLLKGAVMATAAATAAPVLGEPARASAQSVVSQTNTLLDFTAIAQSTEDRAIVASGYNIKPLLKWGDPILPGAPEFDIARLTPQGQAMQFGYNCDFVGYMPLPAGSSSSDHGLLVVNNEYTNPELMFAGFDPKNPTREQVDVELAAHGISVVEIEQDGSGDWGYNRNSRYNHRITVNTPMIITGPAAGHAWLKTSEDPTGTRVNGTLNNCAAGKTPWGTVLSAEENFHQYFGNAGSVAADDPRARLYTRYGFSKEASARLWERHYSRFDVSKEPNESFRHGWVVEIDPYDPTWTPRKRTALGRFKHEAANTVVTPQDKLVLYTGDDERFEYVYKFVAARPYNRTNRAANRDLLDEGTLYAARFNADGSGEWLPLVYGQGPLTEANGFRSQADVVINPRGAGDLLGATKMDRPEDIETNPVNKKVYMVMTNNTQRGTENRAAPDAPNPRKENRHGHIIEVTEANDDHAATTFSWNIFLLCGDPSDESTYFAGYPKDQVSPISSPDNIMFDMAGNLWIATDGQPGTFKVNDGLFAVPVEGPERGYLRQFFSGLPAGEVCGPELTPDNTTLFLAIQHPGEDSTLEQPSSVWPDGNTPPRPSVIAIRADNGSRIGMSQATATPPSVIGMPRTGGLGPLGPLVLVAGAAATALGALIRFRGRNTADGEGEGEGEEVEQNHSSIGDTRGVASEE